MMQSIGTAQIRAEIHHIVGRSVDDQCAVCREGERLHGVFTDDY